MHGTGDYYATLQVEPGADALIIKAAYRALARVFHPDVKGDDRAMKQLNAAWEVLRDPERRARYDAERARRQVAVDIRPVATSFARHPSDDGAGPPQGAPFGSVLNVGRYIGWTIGQVAQVDRPFLEWLRSVPAGRGLRDEIDSILGMRAGSADGGADGQGAFATFRARTESWWTPAPAKAR